MCNRIIYLSSILCLVLSFTSAGLAQTKQPPDTSFRTDPAAEQLFRQLRKAMRELNSLFLRSEYRFGKLGEEVPTAHYTIWMKKPSYFRLEAYNRDGKLTGVLLHDGHFLWDIWPEKRPIFRNEDSATYVQTNIHRYMQRNLPAKDFSIKKEVGRLGAGMIWAVLDLAVFFEDSSAAYAPPVLKYDGTVFRGTETIAGEPCTIIERSFNDRYYQQTIWISQRDYVPRQLRDVIGLSMLENWTEIRMNEPISNDRFSWQPPDEWKQWFPPASEENLPRPASEVPDFEMTLTTGEAVRLSNFRGNVVVLNLWNLNCPPCRQEIPYLQRLHRSYGGRGVVILGVNCGDNRQSVVDFLTKNHVTYLNILVASDAEARFVNNTLNPTGAVPLTYILDTQGKVVEALLGYEADDTRIETTLEKLRIK